MITEVEKAALLIVDDDVMLCDLLVRWLQKSGYRCVAANSAAEAMTALENESFELMLTDINMPGLTGIELLEAIRGRYADLAKIMVTAVDDQVVADHALKMGVYSYLVKPLEKNQTLINVANALRLRQLEIENRMFSLEMDQLVQEQTSEVRKKEAEVRLSREETIRCLSRAAEFRDDDTARHTERMASYCNLLAEKAGLDDDLCALIRAASPLHDVGKIGIPDTILLKPGKLTDDEFMIIKKHPDIGHRILADSTSEMLRLGAVIARTHHEKWDGSGYPDGLAGEEIPIEGRITAICDVFDALTFDRVYKKAFSVDKAVEIIREGRGKHFEPRLVDLLLDSLDEFLRIKERFSEE